MLRARTYPWVLGSAAAFAVLLIADASAQTVTPNAQGNNPPQIQTEGQSPSENLSDRLDRTNGVIRPQGNMDPAIHATPPDAAAGTMPVIPPPGSPGGDQQIKPK